MSYDNLGEHFLDKGFPEYNFVERIKIIQKLQNEINSKSLSIIQILGPSRTGKTQLVEYVLRQKISEEHRPVIRIEGGKILSTIGLIEKIVRDINDLRPNLQIFFDKIRETVSSINLPFLTITPPIPNNPSLDEITQALDATITNALQELAKLNLIIVIDDCHKLPYETLQILINYTKSLTDRSGEYKGLKIILIYIPTKQVRGSQTFRELSTRAKTIAVTLWDVNELEEVIYKTLQKQNLGSLGIKELAEQCFGLPSTLQRCCREYFLEFFNPNQTILDINRRQRQEIMKSVASELWDLTYREIYSQLTSRSALIDTDLYQNVSYSITANFNELIWQSINQMSLKIGGHQEITIHLDELTERMKSQIIRPQNNKEISFEMIHESFQKMAIVSQENYLKQTQSIDSYDPLFEVSDDKVLIYSPDFLFTLRHSEKYQELLRRRPYNG